MMKVLGSKRRLGALVLWGAVAWRCSSPDAVDRPLYRFDGSTMGTYYRVQVAGNELTEERQQTASAAIEAELESVNARMSTWIADSELSLFNRHRETSPFAFSAETFEVLRTAREISERSGGAFDATVGPLVDAWGFGAHGEVQPEIDVEKLEKLRARIGFGKLILDEDSRSVSKEVEDLEVDLSGIAKGYAVDRVAEKLAALGMADYWVEVGGEVRAAGSNARGEPWRLGIERPRATPGTVQRIVPLQNLAVATSGDYRNYREIEGERFSHLIDPRTGWPIRHRLASVSVLHPRCMMADALATALMVLGEDEGYAWAVNEGLPALFLVRSEGESGGFAEQGTPAFWEFSGRDAGR